MDRLQTLLTMLNTRSGDPFVLYALAMEYQRLGQMDFALKTFDRVLEQHPEYLPSYLMAGNAVAKQGDPDKAIAILRAGIEKATGQGDSHTAGELEDALAGLE